MDEQILRLKRKYARIKKPKGNIRYEIIYKKNKPVYGCGPMGDVYEIKFHILDDDSYLYAHANDWCMYSLYDTSPFEFLFPEDNTFEDKDFPEPIEEFEGFSKAKKSKYYDLYLELEKFIDGYE